MSEITRDIECPPYAPVLMESTRAIGYSMESAIADIIDNSISAMATDINIFFDTLSKPYIAILDNGIGMTSDKLTESMRYGSCNPIDERAEDDLGRYGLGLKTASLSQCRSLTVLSKTKKNISARRWNLDHIIETKKWTLEDLSDKEICNLPHVKSLDSYESGTLVLWQSLDKIKKGSLTLQQSVEDKMLLTKKHLELVFHRFLAGETKNKITIKINGIKLEPFDPFFSTKSDVVMDDEKIEIPGKDGKVIIRPYVLPHPSKMTKEELEKYRGDEGLRALQGFYIYRNKRLLTWGTWFNLLRKDEYTKLARVRVDIPNSLDDLWTLDVKKSTAYPPEIVKTRLKQLVETMSYGSKRTWTFRQKKETKTNIVHIWEILQTRDGVKYEVNRTHPILEAILSKLDSDGQKLLNSYLETVQNNLPLNNLHHDMHSDIKIVQDEVTEEKKRVLFLAKQAIKISQNKNVTLHNFETTEPFCEYIDDIKKIYQEICING